MKRRNLGFIGIALAGVLVSAGVGGGAALALSGSFNDVPPNHPFYDDIESVADACITAGYPDGGFHPADPVTRQAMAAFLNRSMSRTVEGTKLNGSPTFGSPTVATGSTVDIASVTVTIPDLPGSCNVPVEVHAYASTYIQTALGNACFTASACNVYVGLRAGNTPAGSQLGRITTDHWAGAFSPTRVFTQQDGTTQTYYLVVDGYNVKENQGFVSNDRAIVATTFPQQATGA